MLNKVLKEASKWVGYLEKKTNNNLESFSGNVGYNNYTRFAQKYEEFWKVNLQGQPWCAVFVSVVFRESLGKENQEKIMPHFHYCPTGVSQFKSMGRWYSSNPAIGDVIFFKEAGTNTACHTGIVYNVDRNRVYTIEGNTSSTTGLEANGGCVAKKSYLKSYNRILGYGRPAYVKLETEYWAKKYLDILQKRGYIQNPEIWSQYSSFVTKSTALALIDKITGGKWDSDEEDPRIHWVQPHVISLCGKKIIEDSKQWLEDPDGFISKALIMALIDKATNGTLEKYKNRTGIVHWAKNNLDSLVEKGIINSPEAWEDYESAVPRDNFMALVCKAFNIK